MKSESQQKLNFSNIAGTKSKFPSNLVIGRT